MDSRDVDLVVWSESEKREAWWCGVMGINAAVRHGETTDVKELPAGNPSTAASRTERPPASSQTVSAA
ncbi:hypothetical protein R4P64_28915 [Rhodococcus sp. IEGM 1366]|uniref:hypothetical protein n=1 Tax=Rhodococcus sp. IEGM 1366 TaxID=3082223 RepID=UPI002953EC85|nr:hypothetical protein [Rhodococcus sp. IEGM 1366]MDV8070564.1 hypothetical protein [Rhodococcus sp. IEGM 1366]